jgi:metallo-beta-lactamase class B
MKMLRVIAMATLAAALTGPVRMAAAPDPEWTRPFPSFRIAGNLYYVGSEDLGSYLVATPNGLILINANLESSPALIRKSVEALGFHFKDIKILLISHGHYDHCAGSAEILRETGAKLRGDGAGCFGCGVGWENRFSIWSGSRHALPCRTC